MGLYDKINCSLDFPDWLDHSNAVFQTKNFDCAFDEYRIDMFGYLYRTLEEPNYLEFVPYNGWVVFYHGLAEFKANFKKGKTERIEWDGE